ncbi:MAG: YigZ family protein [Lachnospiraceae bacterium]
MLLQYKTVCKEAEAEITEKKSRFIAAIVPIRSEGEAVQYIEQVKKLHWNARHHCYAYVLGERFEIQRYSDDGEPGGTAGKPMLDVLLGEEIHDVLAVVTRYFGGTLLGTGGLVRAYSGAVREGLSASNIITKKYGCKLKITADYNKLGKLQYILGQRGIQVLNTEYNDMVMLEVFAPQTEEAAMTKEMVDKTNGQVEISRGSECYY